MTDDLVYVQAVGQHAGPGKSWVHPQGGGMHIVVDEPDGDLLDAANAADAVLAFTATDGWHLLPSPALEQAVANASSSLVQAVADATPCAAIEHIDGVEMRCRRTPNKHRGRHRWRPVEIEPAPLVGVVPPVDLADDDLPPLDTAVECASGHVHDDASNAADCDRIASAGSLQDLTDTPPAPYDVELLRAAPEAPSPEPVFDKAVHRALLAQGYRPEHARQRAFEWRW